MLDALRSLFARYAPIEPAAGAAAPRGAHALQVAACALLLEAAHADDEFRPEERAAIERAMAEHFSLAAAEVGELLAESEAARRDAVDLHEFASVIRAHYTDDDRAALAELLWRVVGADGRLSPHEQAFATTFRRVLDLDPVRFAEARRRASEPGPPA